VNEKLTTAEQKELEKLYASVAHRILQGENKDTIFADLVRQGWSEESAKELIDNVEGTIEEYEEPSEEWKRKKARLYLWPMSIGAIFLIASISLFIYGIISPEFEYILPIGLFVVGALNFFSAFPMWLKYRK